MVKPLPDRDHDSDEHHSVERTIARTRWVGERGRHARARGLSGSLAGPACGFARAAGHLANGLARATGRFADATGGLARGLTDAANRLVNVSNDLAGALAHVADRLPGALA